MAFPAPDQLPLLGYEIDDRYPEDQPEALKQAVLMLVGHWYEFRASYGAADQPVSYPPAYDRMVAGYRARRL